MSQTVATADDLEAVNALFYERGWTDGLPIIPPTRERVERMVAGGGRPGDALVGRIPPKWGEATVERIAVNAVMAGCRPEHLPVVLAAVEALLDDRVNLHGVQCTTHVTTPLIVVNGSLSRRLGINGGPNCFGQGWIANAAIGRAVRLILVNLGGARPGRIDKATFGHPGKYAYCVAENEAESPWEPFHVEQGYRPDESAVTVFAAEAPHNVNNHSFQPYRLLDAVAGTMTTLGANNFYVMGDYVVVLGVPPAGRAPQIRWDVRRARRAQPLAALGGARGRVQPGATGAGAGRHQDLRRRRARPALARHPRLGHARGDPQDRDDVEERQFLSLRRPGLE